MEMPHGPGPLPLGDTPSGRSLEGKDTSEGTTVSPTEGFGETGRGIEKPRYVS